jgi:hypothetical protein
MAALASIGAASVFRLRTVRRVSLQVQQAQHRELCGIRAARVHAWPRLALNEALGETPDPVTVDDVRDRQRRAQKDADVGAYVPQEVRLSRLVGHL